MQIGIGCGYHIFFQVFFFFTTVLDFKNIKIKTEEEDLALCHLRMNSFWILYCMKELCILKSLFEINGVGKQSDSGIGGDLVDGHQLVVQGNRVGKNSGWGENKILH